jgi:hypothetical protein
VQSGENFKPEILQDYVRNIEYSHTIVERFYKSELGTSLKERNKIIREFVKTETVYVNALDSLYNVHLIFILIELVLL